jgi:protein-S-isoprenylcysteine O-methyltransferase Ste14
VSPPLPFVWPYALAFWPAYIWAFIPEFRFMRRKDSSAVDAGSLQFILAGMQIALVLAFIVSFWMPHFHGVAHFWIGIALLIGGSALRRHCFRVLGEYFTYAVKTAKDQPVIDRGAYRWVRHPSYTGGVLMFSGIGLALSNWVSFALLFVTTVAVYTYRVRIEERALLETIGEPYREFMSRRKRFIPWVM